MLLTGKTQITKYPVNKFEEQTVYGVKKFFSKRKFIHTEKGT